MSKAPLRRVIAFRLVTHDPERLARFYAEALGAVPSAAHAIAGTEGELLGAASRTRLAIGAERIDLDAFADPGAPYPDDIAADDLRFQHCAVVVADIVAAHARAVQAGARAISRDGPVRLPPSAGGVTAVKLRDPEGHPFELLQFPSGSVPRWAGVAANDRGVLGIDHSAIAVADAAASTAFYAAHGLMAAGAGLNQGPTQATLDGLDAPVVDVVALHPAVSEPHLELLGYHSGRLAPPRVEPRDVAATRIAWASDRDGSLLDPDGHRHQLIGAGGLSR